MYRFLLLLFLLAGSRTVFTQIPGYLGKRTTIQVDAQITPALRNPTAGNKTFFDGFYGEKKSGSVAFNWRAGLTAGYTLSRRHQLVLGANYLKTGAVVYAETPYIDPFGNYVGADVHDLFYNLTGKTIELGMRFFNPTKGAIAPFGRYHTWALQATFLDGKIVDKRTSLAYDGSERTTHAPIGIDPKVQHWEISYEFGQNIIVHDVVVLNIAGRFNLPLRLDKIFVSEDSGFEGNQQSYDDAVFKRMLGHSLFTFKIGAGLIL